MNIAIPIEFELVARMPTSEEVMSAIQKCLNPSFIAQDAEAAPPASATPPAIGAVWPGQGGIYAGICRAREGKPAYHLILCQEAPKKDYTWQAAQELAKTVEADGRKDFTVPTRWESALLYANLQEQFETDCWHWTSTQYPKNRAWVQYFDDGSQSSSTEGYKRRVRFVRKVLETV